MKAKEITFEERKTIQLEMLKEIDAFCRANNIRYTLACGTLIGAIRHGGYIPWDDDVDITMPYEDMMRFKQLFNSRTMKYCDVETEINYGYAFSRIADKRTYRKYGWFGKDLGICIDVYPVIECWNDGELLCNFIEEASLLIRKRKKIKKIYNLITGRIPFVKSIPGYMSFVKKYYYFMTNKLLCEGSGVYYQIGGPLKGKNNNFYKNTWTFNPFEEIIDIPFESFTFKAPARYDEFLKVRYGDYMKLPPEDQRHPYHGAKYYWK